VGQAGLEITLLETMEAILFFQQLLLLPVVGVVLMTIPLVKTAGQAVALD
jgi:hypothetical protein